jgi:hypothetical protein
MRAETKKPLIHFQKINGFEFGCGDGIHVRNGQHPAAAIDDRS